VPHRYATWYFVTATTGEGSPRPDGREIDEFLWVTPRDAIRARDERRLALMSPTWLTLFRLRDFATAAEAVDAIRGQTPSLFETRVVATTGGRVALWAGDAGYVTQRLDVAGARNRLWMLDSGWRYEQTA
jgi:hypothetical protein